jgi:hypothetical protein
VGKHSEDSVSEAKKQRSYRLLVLREGVKCPAPAKLDAKKTSYPTGERVAQVTSTVRSHDGKELSVAVIFRDPAGLGVTIVGANGSLEIPLEAIAFAIPE